MIRSLRLSSSAVFLRTALTGLLALGLPGCTAGQTGGEVLESDRDGCTIVSATELDVEDETSLGVEGSVLLAMLASPLSAEVAFPGSNDQLSVTPAAGDTTVDVEFDVDPSTLRALERSPESRDGVETLEAAPVENDCDPQVAVDGTVRVRFGNGALDDEFEATIVFDSASLARASVALDLANLDGSLVVTPKDDAFDVARVSLDLALAKGSLSGRLDALLESIGDEVAAASGSAIATFPKVTCDRGYPLAKTDATVVELGEALAERGSFDFSWPDERATTMTLASTIDGACYVPGSGSNPEAVELLLTSAVATADGGIDGSWALRATMSLDSAGELASIAVFRDAYLAAVFPSATFAEDSGITGFAPSSEPNTSFDFTWNDDVTDALPAAGQMTFFGIGASACAEADPEETEGGGSSPGCAGADITEIGTASFRATAE